MKAVRVAVLLFVFAVAASFAEDTNTLPTTITVDGVTYSNVTWRTATSASVTIFHETGVASIPLEKLPPELQRRFGYDPQKAAAYRAQESAAELQHMVEMQARERLREQHEAEAAATAVKQQQAQEELAREQQRANQMANANSAEVISVFHVDGAINALPTGGYVAQLALTNHTIVCAHFDEDGRRYLEDASRKYAEWNAQQDPLEQQLQVQVQPGTIILSGGKGGARVVGGGGLAYAMGGAQQPTPMASAPVSTIYAVHEENSSCYFLKGSREAGQTGGIKQYSWP
ncbi:MAG: hypothetical protein ACLPT4_01795 [Verrucomicrobiia bacterium]